MNLLLRHGFRVCEVKAGHVRSHPRTALLHVVTQNFTQGVLQQVGHGVIATDACATIRINRNIKDVANLHLTFFHVGVMPRHLGLNLLRVDHADNRGVIFHHTGIAHLTAAFTVKRRCIEHHHAVFTRGHFFNLFTVHVESDDFARLMFGFIVTGEGRIRAVIFETRGHLKFSACASLVALLLHSGVKAIHVHGHVAFTANVSGQVNRETVRVMKLKGHLAVQNAVRRFGDSLFKHLHALRERLSKTFFFLGKHFLDLRIFDFRIGFTHFSHDGINQTGKERLAGAKLIAMANGAAADAAKHVGAAFIARQNAVGHRERAGANVVGDHLQRGAFRIHVRGARLFNSLLNRGKQILKEVDFVVAVNVLQNSGNTFKPHAGVHRGFRKLVHHTVFITVKLHEHQVPNFDVTVAVFVRASRRAALHFFTVVVEDF